MVSIGKWLLFGLVGAFAISALVDPNRAKGTIGAFGGIGTALGSLGAGVQSLFTGVGIGSAKLFNPLFTLRDLIYGPQAGVQIQSDISQVSETGNIQASQVAHQQQAIELDAAAPFTPITTGFGGSPLGTPPNYSPALAEQGAAEAANTAIQGFSYTSSPGLNPNFGGTDTSFGWNTGLEGQGVSQRVILQEQALGIVVSPEVNETVTAQNSGNATSVSSASANYVAGAAQALGYSTGRPRS